MDADILIRGPIGELLTLNLVSHSTAGVQDVYVPQIGSRGGIAPWRGLGLDPQAKIVNTGVLVMDLDRWREERIGKRALDLAVRLHARFGWADQAALNAVLNGHWHELPPRLNTMKSVFDDDSGTYAVFGREEVEAAREDPAIFHFEGAVKPRHAKSAHAFTGEWRVLAAELGWHVFPHRLNWPRRRARSLIRTAAHAARKL